jgi:hypothetical protein
MSEDPVAGQDAYLIFSLVMSIVTVVVLVGGVMATYLSWAQGWVHRLNLVMFSVFAMEFIGRELVKSYIDHGRYFASTPIGLCLYLLVGGGHTHFREGLFLALLFLVLTVLASCIFLHEISISSSFWNSILRIFDLMTKGAFVAYQRELILRLIFIIKVRAAKKNKPIMERSCEPTEDIYSSRTDPIGDLSLSALDSTFSCNTSNSVSMVPTILIHEVSCMFPRTLEPVDFGIRPRAVVPSELTAKETPDLPAKARAQLSSSGKKDPTAITKSTSLFQRAGRMVKKNPLKDRSSSEPAVYIKSSILKYVTEKGAFCFSIS